MSIYKECRNTYPKIAFFFEITIPRETVFLFKIKMLEPRNLPPMLYRLARTPTRELSNKTQPAKHIEEKRFNHGCDIIKYYLIPEVSLV